MKENRINFISSFFPGLGLGLVTSYENGYLYTMGSILCFQFYLDIKIIKWQTKKLQNTEKFNTSKVD